MRTCTARVHKEYSLPVFDPGPVRVSRDDSLKTGGSRVKRKGVEVVQDIEGHTAGFDDCGLWERAGPGSLIIVAPNGDGWRDLAQARKDCWSADVSRMNNDLTTAQSSKRLGTEEPVGIRDNAH